MSTSTLVRRAAAFWLWAWDCLGTFEDTLSTTPQDLQDRRITRLENELAALKERAVSTSLPA